MVSWPFLPLAECFLFNVSAYPVLVFAHKKCVYFPKIMVFRHRTGQMPGVFTAIRYFRSNRIMSRPATPGRRTIIHFKNHLGAWRVNLAPM